MPRYRIKRPHPAKTPLRAGQIVENPQWKNIDYLLSRGYIEVVADASAKKTEVQVEPQVEVEVEPQAEAPAAEAAASTAKKPAKEKK